MNKLVLAFLSILLSVAVIIACQPSSPLPTTVIPTQPTAPQQAPSTVPSPQPPPSTLPPTPNTPPNTYQKLPGSYPRLANYWVSSLKIGKSEAMSLTKWDLIVVRHPTVDTEQEALKWIRKQNPNIKILAWINAGLDRSIQFFPEADESWFLHYADDVSNPKTPKERRVVLWTMKADNTDIVGLGMNPASDWSTYLPQFVQEKLMSSGLFDGVFYDCPWEAMWKPRIDINNDGIPDSPGIVNQLYQKGMTGLLKLTRELIGPEAIVFGNPGSEWGDNSPYWEYANGHMQENALGTQFGNSWPKVWEIYQRNMKKPSPPLRMHWIAADTNDERYDQTNPRLPPTELQKMRFGLGITLLGDGYFGFDQGSRGGHGHLWWFPEYDANLGLARGDAKERSDGIWIREFDNGIVVVNPTAGEKIIDFENTYQDITTSTRSSHFGILPRDGRILIK